MGIVTVMCSKSNTACGPDSNLLKVNDLYYFLLFNGLLKNKLKSLKAVSITNTVQRVH